MDSACQNTQLVGLHETVISTVWLIVIGEPPSCSGCVWVNNLRKNLSTIASRVLLGGSFRNAFGFCIGCKVEWV